MWYITSPAKRIRNRGHVRQSESESEVDIWQYGTFQWDFVYNMTQIFVDDAHINWKNSPLQMLYCKNLYQNEILIIAEKLDRRKQYRELRTAAVAGLISYVEKQMWKKLPFKNTAFLYAKNMVSS